MDQQSPTAALKYVLQTFIDAAAHFAALWLFMDYIKMLCLEFTYFLGHFKQSTELLLLRSNFRNLFHLLNILLVMKLRMEKKGFSGNFPDTLSTVFFSLPTVLFFFFLNNIYTWIPPHDFSSCQLNGRSRLKLPPVLHCLSWYCQFTSVPLCNWNVNSSYSWLPTSRQIFCYQVFFVWNFRI